eukprot:2121558-Rhodomonas_salina.1
MPVQCLHASSINVPHWLRIPGQLHLHPLVYIKVCMSRGAYPVQSPARPPPPTAPHASDPFHTAHEDQKTQAQNQPPPPPYDCLCGRRGFFPQVRLCTGQNGQKGDMRGCERCPECMGNRLLGDWTCYRISGRRCRQAVH